MVDDIFNLPGQGVDFGNPVNLIPKKLYSDCSIPRVDREHLHHIPAHPKFVAYKIDIVALILDFHQFLYQFVPVFGHTGAKRDYHVMVIDRVSQRIDAGNACHNNHVPTLPKCGSCRMAQLFDLVIDRGILFNISIGVGNIRFRLIVIVVGYKIFYRVVRKKLLKLGTELSCQCFIMGEDKGWTVDVGDDICHRECFSRAGNSKQGLFFHPAQNPFGQLFDCLWLISCRLIGRYKFKSFWHRPRLLFHLSFSHILKTPECASTLPVWTMLNVCIQGT